MGVKVVSKMERFTKKYGHELLTTAAMKPSLSIGNTTKNRKADLAFSLNKPIFVLAPERSEMRSIVKDNQYISSCNDKEEIKEKLENLIRNRMVSTEPVYPFGDYFSDENFKRVLDEILLDSTLVANK